MKFRLQAIVAVAALVAIGAVHAQSVTRAEVKAEVMQARAAGQLVPAGSLSPEDRTYAQQVAAQSATTRTDVVETARAARSARAKLKGPLRDRTYNPWQTEVFGWRSDLHTRGEVKGEVMNARVEHALVPAGESPLPMANERHTAFFASN